MQLGQENSEEQVQDLKSLHQLLAQRDEFGVPKFYLENSYRAHELLSAGWTTNYGLALFDALLEQPVNLEKVELLLTIRDNEGNPLIDFEVYKEEFGLNADGSKIKKNILSALLHADVEHNVKISWLKKILNFRTISGELSVNITPPKIKNLLLNEAAVLDAEYSKILFKEIEKQALIVRRQDASTRISWAIKNGNLLELKLFLSDKNKGVPYAFAHYEQPNSHSGGPLGDALSAVPPNKEVIQTLLKVHDNEGNLLYGGSAQPRSPDVPLIIQAALLQNLEYLGLMLGIVIE